MSIKGSRWGVGLLVALLSASAVTPRVAQACGGCFSPPSPTMVQTVTYHRMALATSATQTTLWDQFGYAGRAEEFSWILPIQGGPDVRVELADVRFLAALDDNTGAQFGPVPNSPSRWCPSCYTPPPEVEYYCSEADNAFGPPMGGAGSFADASASADASAPSDSSVEVLREEAVGPYEVVVLRGTDAGALRAWLTMRRFVVPAAMEPVITHYVNLRMDFVALRLSDMAGVGAMQPVRVVAPGYQPMLPLRMVAAGIGDSVELVLFTLADSRLEAQNFPNIAIGERELAYDFANRRAPSEIFRATERALRARTDGRAWLTESAQRTDPGFLQNIVRQAETRYLAEGDAGGPSEDLTVALAGLGERPVLTRLHADLHVSKLDRDLMLSASVRDEQPRFYQFGAVENAPTPPECAPLSCETGLVQGGEGQLRGPFGETLAPSYAFPARYARGDAPAYTPRFARGEPRYADGRPYTVRPTRYERRCGAPPPEATAGGGLRCAVGPSVGATTPSRGRRLALGLGVAAGLALSLGARTARARRRGR